jgi:hypothetical protein
MVFVYMEIICNLPNDFGSFITLKNIVVDFDREMILVKNI